MFKFYLNKLTSKIKILFLTFKVSKDKFKTIIIKTTTKRIKKENKLKLSIYFLSNKYLLSLMEGTLDNLSLKEKLKSESAETIILNEKKIKVDKKASKKMAKAVSVIQFQEKKPVEQLFSSKITKYMWIYHFGNGDEDDQISLINYFSGNDDNSTECRVYIFPGLSYAYLSFQTIESASKFINYDKTITGPIKGNVHNVKFENGERACYAFFTEIKIEDVIQNTESTFPNASFNVDIPGLYIFDEYISKQEEAEMINKIDNEQWHKLSHRRVQHYGYEFIYGANNIDKFKKIGSLPDFTIFVNESNFNLI